MLVTIVSRKPFESKTYKYVKSVETRGDSVIITAQYPEEEEFSVTFDRHEVVLNINTRED